jgi:pyruvate dehydrogenase E2 component (dihydrolipoamide acetyltransferase)
MPINVIMPLLGESILEGTVTKWLKKPGDRITRDEPFFEVSTDKVDTEIPSPADGVLREILIQEGGIATVGATVAILESMDAIPASAALPVEGETDPQPEGPMTRAEAVTSTTPEMESEAFVRTSPLVRRIAREHGIRLATVRGTGLSGRITRDDILGTLKPATVPAPAQASMEAPAPAAAIAPIALRPIERVPVSPPVVPPATTREEDPAAGDESETVSMTPMRKAIAEHMILSRRTSAHVQTVFEVDMSPIVRLRDQHADAFEARTGIKLNYTTFFVKALVDTVRDFPILNSSVSGDEIIYRKPVNVGVAVALDTGLIVPVVKDAHLKSFTDLALAIQDLASRARGRKLKPEEVQQGTITITNPGIFGALMGTPIINQPQVAILYVGSLEKRPVVINDAIAIRTMVYLVLSFDHRIIDGAVADQAMSALKSRLQLWDHWVE